MSERAFDPNDFQHRPHGVEISGTWPTEPPCPREVWLEVWDRENTFQQSVDRRPAEKPYVFFEGPPSANGKPGIHHVMARAIKDIFCRFQTLKGHRVERKAGWDTHGLPVELGVEKEFGITKEDIGTKLTVEEYNDACRKTVMRYTRSGTTSPVKWATGWTWMRPTSPTTPSTWSRCGGCWPKCTRRACCTRATPSSPTAPWRGRLSSHELNQPGTYRDVKDTTIVAQFHATPEFVQALLAKCGLPTKG